MFHLFTIWENYVYYIHVFVTFKIETTKVTRHTYNYHINFKHIKTSCYPKSSKTSHPKMASKRRGLLVAAAVLRGHPGHAGHRHGAEGLALRQDPERRGRWGSVFFLGGWERCNMFFEDVWRCFNIVFFFFLIYVWICIENGLKENMRYRDIEHDVIANVVYKYHNCFIWLLFVG